MNALTLCNTAIRQLDGLYSLNDLHKAAGGEAKHRPNYFLENQQTKSLIDEIQAAGIPASKTVVGKGKQQGTYACRELVIAYAAWINAAFHLKVIRVFLNAVSTGLSPSDQPVRVRYLTCFEDGKWSTPMEVPYWSHVITKDQMLARIRQGDKHFDHSFVAEIALACADRFMSETAPKKNALAMKAQFHRMAE